MISTSARNRSEAQPFRDWLIVVYVVVISIAVDAALLLCAGSGWSWIGSAVAVSCATLISAGTLFSILKMITLGR
jgi:protein-S-isoprenylcysteine O-methyltransferase Ste14